LSPIVQLLIHHLYQGVHLVISFPLGPGHGKLGKVADYQVTSIMTHLYMCMQCINEYKIYREGVFPTDIFYVDIKFKADPFI
jgi:hypothetical protein